MNRQIWRVTVGRITSCQIFSFHPYSADGKYTRGGGGGGGGSLTTLAQRHIPARHTQIHARVDHSAKGETIQYPGGRAGIFSK